nr:PQQ-binding-like beta-propeller repeat protein [Streptomyces sp. ST1020]
MDARRIEQVVSRYNAVFKVSNLKMGYGLDDNVYLVVGGTPDGRLLRLKPDGTKQTFFRAGAAALAVTANASGTIAIAEAHFAHRIVFYDDQFRQLGHYDDVAADNTLGHNAPSGIEAVPSGFFYALDQHRLRVVRLTPTGTLDREVTLTGLPAEVRSTDSAVGLRVVESSADSGRIYTAWPHVTNGTLGFVCASDLRTGQLLWSKPVKVSGELNNSFDVTGNGGLCVVKSTQELVIYDADGGETPAPLDLPADGHTVGHLRLRDYKDGDQHRLRYYVKRNDERYLFEVYDGKTGAAETPVLGDVELLTVRYDADVWTAGKPMPLTITHSPGSWPNRPRFRVWLRPLGVPEFTELPLTGGAVTPPADARGLYQVRVSPDVAGRLSEYVVDGMVEIRPAAPTPGTTVQGSLSLMSCRIVKDRDGKDKPVNLNRLHYGRGEAVTLRVEARMGAGVPQPAAVTVVLKRDGERLHEWNVGLDPAKHFGQLVIGADITGTLEPGRHVLDADPPAGLLLTIAPQYLEIGPGFADRPDYHLTLYTDIYGPNGASFPADPRELLINPPTNFPPAFRDLPDVVQAHLHRTRTLGLNLAVDRLGVHWGTVTFATEYDADAEIAARLKASPVAVHYRKALFEDVGRRTIAGYGAYGIEEQGVLQSNDTFLPLDWPGNHESRKLEELKTDLATGTRTLDAYAAFRGWTWGANWWIGPVGAVAANADEKAEYTTASEAIAAGTSTTWLPVLDTVTERSITLKPTEAAELRRALNEASPGRLTAATAPYRQPQTVPPLLFAEVDEVDLHYQAEQIQLPLSSAHMVDFYRRPGKPVWGHPELTNDDGTGGMFLPTLFQQVMRGPNGTGMVTDENTRQMKRVVAAPERGGGSGTQPGEPRSGGAGKTSVQRAAFDMIARLGPAVAGADSANRVAIVVSTRMLRLETFERGWFSSLYFMRLYSAWAACLHAHRPASFVFTEDVDAEGLRGYQAVLLVGQQAELDPPLAAALNKARETVPVYADDTCHPSIRDAYGRLGLAFDRINRKDEPACQNDDTAYYRMRRAFLDQGAALAQTLSAVTPVAECDNPEVLLSEWTAGDITYIWAVNTTRPDWEPEIAWRVGLLCAQHLPVQTRLTVRLPALHQVIDLLTGKPVSLLGGTFTADLRTVPARLYAIVPLLHDPLPTASEDGFGPHVRDIAVSADGDTAALNTFDWDHNLYGLDLATGRTRWRRRLGHHFAYAPTTRPDGFVVQGFDINAAEGYHLYQLDPAGQPQRRFALYGLPKKATDWSKSDWGYDYGLNNFASAPGGSWIATSGDLGLAVWRREVDEQGQEQWSESWADSWWSENRRIPLRLLALDDDTLITFADNTVSGRSAANGALLWSFSIVRGAGFGGTFGVAAVSGDRRTAAITAQADGGRVYVIRDGALVNTIPTAASELSLSADGTFLAVTTGNQLRAYDTATGLLWTYTGDDFLRRPRVSPDGSRVAVGSELGTLAVLERDGTLLTATDLRALPVPAWLPDGDLLVATWMGTVLRYDAGLDERWRTRLVPEERDIRRKLTAPDPVPVVRRTDWGNARSEPLELTPNLVVDTHAYLFMQMTSPLGTYDMGPVQDPQAPSVFAPLTDGSAAPPAQPWLRRPLLAGLASVGADPHFELTVDTFRYQLKLTGVTFAEDPAHPESWLRDVLIQWWDARDATWRDGPMLLSDQALHSHELELYSGRFRLVSTGGGVWPQGNLRLGELVFHGEVLGASHRDVVEDNAVAVLFGDRADDVQDLLAQPGSVVDIQEGGAYSGTRCLRVPVAMPRGQYPIRHGFFFLDTMHDWNFEIVEHPAAPGQYRYLRFAWKALSDHTTGIGLRLGSGGSADADGGGHQENLHYVAVNAGVSHFPTAPQVTEIMIPEEEFPHGDWKLVRIDLWAQAAGKLKRITQIGLRTDGGGALFDQILLGRTEADLDEWPA